MSRPFLVTGGAGFIGSAAMRHLLEDTDHRVLVVDKLTYAGNLDSIPDPAKVPRLVVAQADICDAAAMRALCAEHPHRGCDKLGDREPCRSLDRRARSLHRDQHPVHLHGALMPKPGRRGCPREVEFREVINAVRYLVRSGCGWRMLPIHFGHWRTVYGWFRELARRFLFQTIHDVALMLDGRWQGGR